MKKDSFEKLDDWFINLYEEWLFVRCFEYSAILLWEILWYKIFVDLNENIESLSKQLRAWEKSLWNKKETRFL
jgi:hypothetical protein